MGVQVCAAKPIKHDTSKNERERTWAATADCVHFILPICTTLPVATNVVHFIVRTRYKVRLRV